MSPREQRSESASVPNHGTSPFHGSVQGSPPPAGRRRSRRSWSLAFFITVLSAFAFTAAPALAAAPEAPNTEAPSPLGATSATFKGVLNPGTKPQSGSYEFLYKKVANGAGCEGESATPAGIMSGFAKQPVTEPVGLEANTEYTVCLLARNMAAPEETTVGNAVPFKTTSLAPTVSSESSNSIRATEARFPPAEWSHQANVPAIQVRRARRAAAR